MDKSPLDEIESFKSGKYFDQENIKIWEKYFPSTYGLKGKKEVDIEDFVNTKNWFQFSLFNECIQGLIVGDCTNNGEPGGAGKDLIGASIDNFGCLFTNDWIALDCESTLIKAISWHDAYQYVKSFKALE